MKLRCVAVCVLMIGVSGLFAEDDGNKFKAKLIGFQETPSILSNGTGSIFRGAGRFFVFSGAQIQAATMKYLVEVHVPFEAAIVRTILRIRTTVRAAWWSAI